MSVLYPPVIDSYMPAFPVGAGKCRIYFSLSKYNGAKDFQSLHVSIVKQKNNANVVSYKDSNGRYRATGIILNVKPQATDDNLYYFEITNDDLKGDGFEIGEIYKVQIRFCSVNDYIGTSKDGQAAQLAKNASGFSEQSTVCVIKAIARMDVKIPVLNYNSINMSGLSYLDGTINKIAYTTLDLSGTIVFNNDEGEEITSDSEVLYSYNIKLYDDTGFLKEDSGDLYVNDLKNLKSFRYLLKTELEDTLQYKLSFSFTTNNYFVGSFDYDFIVELEGTDVENPLSIITADNDSSGIMSQDTSIMEEQEEGRIGLKIIELEGKPFTGNICIRRSDSKTNFKIQNDIKILPVVDQNISELDIVYDYSIESGVYYKYAVQVIDVKKGRRSVLRPEPDEIIPVMRDFEYSFLVGDKVMTDSKGNTHPQQLKLKFNNLMNSYKIQVMESKTESIGGTYPVITRNAALKYRIFPVTGTITFLADENKLFCTRKDIYGKQAGLYERVRTFKSTGNHVHIHENPPKDDTPQHKIIDSPSYDVERIGPSYVTDTEQVQDQYDYIYEKDFRNEVLNFLYDGKPKLFKSPTEGNIIIRLTDVNCTPNKSLDRLIYDFSSNGNEIAEATYENYVKYGFLQVGEAVANLVKIEYRIGQVQKDFNVNENILYSIFTKYDSEERNIAGKTKRLNKVQNIRITIEDEPLRYVLAYDNNGNPLDYVLGNKMSVDGSQIYILSPQRIYDFDSVLSYERPATATTEGGIQFIGDEEGKVTTVKATIDFIYEIATSKYEGKNIASFKRRRHIGQLFGHYEANVSLCSEISRRYRYDTVEVYRKVEDIKAIEIEAQPGCVFKIQDLYDINIFEYHEINDTGVLRLYDIEDIRDVQFYGIRNSRTGEIVTVEKDGVTPISTDMIINYKCVLNEGTYEVEKK